MARGAPEDKREAPLPPPSPSEIPVGNGLDAADPFNPAALRLDQSVLEAGGARKLITLIPVRKPRAQDFFRVHPDPGYRLTPAAIIELKDEREYYLIAPSIVPDIPSEYDLCTIYTVINRQGVLSLWPVKLPSLERRRRESWRESAGVAVGLGMRQWIKIRPDMSLGGYETITPLGNWSDPEWPDLTFAEILKIAFRDLVIDTPEHPVIQRLLGAI